VSCLNMSTIIANLFFILKAEPGVCYLWNCNLKPCWMHLSSSHDIYGSSRLVDFGVSIDGCLTNTGICIVTEA
jgi:hypothetical protein